MPLQGLFSFRRLRKQILRQEEPSHNMATSSDDQSVVQQPLNFINFDEAKCKPQLESIIFNKIPGEIRDLIFYYALCDYEDKSSLYDENTCYRRPGYFAPRRTDTALLRTCQRVYRETWFLPLTTREHTLFLAWPSRCPVRVTEAKELQKALSLINTIHGRTEIDHIRVFPQLCRLEPGDDLQAINDMPHFYPRRFTITVRHTDWWSWESDEPISIGGRFVDICRFPESVRELHLELESLERRKDQINSIANQMISKWQFQRKDGVRLSAKDSAVTTMRWSGSSTWNDVRWVRDETRPDTLDYYVAAVTFKPVLNAPENQTDLDSEINRAPLLETQGFTPLTPSCVNLTVSSLKAANVPSGTSAADAVLMVESHRRAHQIDNWPDD